MPCHAPTMPFFSRPQHSTAVCRRPCCAVALRRTALSEHGIANVNQTRPHCVNQLGKTHSKSLPERHGTGAAWERHAMCESALTVSSTQTCTIFPNASRTWHRQFHEKRVLFSCLLITGCLFVSRRNRKRDSALHGRV